MNQNVLIPDNDGTVPYNETVRSKLYAMGYTFNPARAKVKLRGFTGWKNPQLCYAQTTQAIKQRHRKDDVIVMLGSKSTQRPMHVILVDAHNKVVFDNNKDSAYDGVYHPGDGYFRLGDGARLYDDMHRVTVNDFLNATQQGYEGATMKKLVRIKRKALVAKVDEQVMQDVIKSLYLMMHYIDTDNDKIKLPATLKANALKWSVNLKKFLAQFRIPNDDFVALLNAARNVSPYSEKIAALAPVVGNMILKSKEKLFADRTIPKSSLEQLMAAGSYFRTNKETAGRKLLKLAGSLKDPELLALFNTSTAGGKVSKTGASQSKAKETMQALTQKFLKKKSVQLSKDESAQMKKKSPEAYKQFKKAQREFFAVPNAFLRAAVRKSGKAFIDYGKFIDSINKAKISHGFPTGFVGNIDENGEFYTTGGLQMDQKLWGVVTMNPDYGKNPNKMGYYCMARQLGDTSPGRRYTLEHVTGPRQDKKFQTMDRTKDKLDEIRQGKLGWLNDLMNGTGRDQLRAAELELIYLLGARPGNKGNATVNKDTGEKVDTFGITTLLTKHVKPLGNGLDLNYTGKKSTDQYFQLKPINKYNKKVIEIVKQQIEGKGPRDPVWIDAAGKVIPTQDVGIYAKRKSGDPKVTLYTFRYMAANKMASDIIAKSPFKKDKLTKERQSEVEDWFNKQMEKIGEALHHHTGNKVTGKTAIKNYVNPIMLHRFFIGLGLRVPDNIPNISAANKKLLKGK